MGMDGYYLKVLYDIFQIPCICWDEKDVFWQSGADADSHVIFADEKLRMRMESIIASNHFPVLYLDNESIFYGGFRDMAGRNYAFGPVSRESTRKPVKQAGFGLMIKLLALAFCQSTGEQIPYTDIIILGNDELIRSWKSEENLEDYMLLQSENDREHIRGMVYENQLVENVKCGNVEAVQEMMGRVMPSIGEIGEVSSNSQRQMEYMTVIMITLITRAAVEGGMNPEEAYVLGDIYIRKLEKCRSDTGALTMLGMKAQMEFTKKVREAKEHKSRFLYVDRCKDYIAKNLRKDIKVSDIAPAIGISRTYLTHKFTEVEGMSIQQYILKEKCEHAANLLKYSDYPIALISEYFCFSSQSHFGNSFKRLFGMTPKEYRILNSHVISETNV